MTTSLSLRADTLSFIRELTDMKKKSKSVHAGHRTRMLKKYKKLGAEAFEAHELLEMLLYYSIRQINTNELAHQLISDCGSVSKVMTSQAGTLEKTKGIGERSALLISLARDTARRGELDKLSSVPLNNEFRITSYISSWFKGKPRGVVMAMFLDKSEMLIETVTISAGRLFRPDSYPPVILQKAMELEAEYVIIAHNHWNNCTEPSIEDLILTGNIRSSLGANKMELLNHYIVTEYDCIPTNVIPKENKNG